MVFAYKDTNILRQRRGEGSPSLQPYSNLSCLLGCPQTHKPLAEIPVFILSLTKYPFSLYNIIALEKCEKEPPWIQFM